MGRRNQEVGYPDNVTLYLTNICLFLVQVTLFSYEYNTNYDEGHHNYKTEINLLIAGQICIFLGIVICLISIKCINILLILCSTFSYFLGVVLSLSAWIKSEESFIVNQTPLLMCQQFFLQLFIALLGLINVFKIFQILHYNEEDNYPLYKLYSRRNEPREILVYALLLFGLQICIIGLYGCILTDYHEERSYLKMYLQYQLLFAGSFMFITAFALQVLYVFLIQYKIQTFLNIGLFSIGQIVFAVEMIFSMTKFDYSFYASSGDFFKQFAIMILGLINIYRLHRLNVGDKNYLLMRT